MPDNNLYMLALVPSPGLRDQIEEIRREFAAAYDCKAALKPPVHITLYPPYKAGTDHEAAVRSALGPWCATLLPFAVVLKGFDAFRKNGVIYIHVENDQALKELHQGIFIRMNRIVQPEHKSTQPFHAHITIGRKDIPPARFPEALKDYLPRKLNASFLAGHIEFWKHNGTSWQPLHRFAFRDRSGSPGQAALF